MYLRSEKFNQPIFGANNLTGMVFSVRPLPALPLKRTLSILTLSVEGIGASQVADGGPSSTNPNPPWDFTLYFKQGGCGTFLPLFFRILEAVSAGSIRPARNG